MAEVITAKSIGGMRMLIRGKLGNQVFQVRNGKQIVMQMPKRRATMPSEKELERRRRFAEAQAVYNSLTAEELKEYAKAWKSGGYKFNGKRYCTLRGFVFAVAFAKECAKVDTTPLNRQATPASALPTGCTTLAPIGDPKEEGRKYGN